MSQRMIMWSRPRPKRGRYDQAVRPRLVGTLNWKIVEWWTSGVVEIRDRRYNWVFRIVGTTDPRLPTVALGTLSHEVAVMALRKIERVAGGGAHQPGGAPCDHEFYPNLWEHLSRSTYDDGTPRQLSSLVIVGGGSEWRGCLSDRDNDRVCWKVGESLEALLLSLESAAANEEPRDWRQAQSTNQKKKR